MAGEQRRIIVGTRGSRLALRQTALIVETLQTRFPSWEIITRVVATDADRVQDRPISHFGDKGVFVRSIERELLAGRIDLAVHSLKDVPADTEAPELRLVAFSRREDPRDCLIARGGVTLDALSSGARIGTSSLRRRVQLRMARSDLVAEPIRGNVDTRLARVLEGQYDGILLAVAGLRRLGLSNHISDYLPVDRFVPDAGQGIIVVQARASDPIGALISETSDHLSHCAATAERAVVRALGADCRSPVGAYATVADGVLLLRGMAATEDGSRVVRSEIEGPLARAPELGSALGEELLARLSA